MSILYVAVIIAIGLVAFTLSILCYYQDWYRLCDCLFFLFKVSFALAFIMFIVWGVYIICLLPSVLLLL